MSRSCVAIESLHGQLLVALQIELGIGEQRFVVRLGGYDLVELCLIGTAVDLGEQIAGPHVLTLDEDDFVQRPVDANMDGHGVVGLNRAEPGQINGHFAGLRHCGNHRYRRNGRHGHGFEQFPQEQPQADPRQADQNSPYKEPPEAMPGSTVSVGGGCGNIGCYIRLIGFRNIARNGETAAESATGFATVVARAFCSTRN